MAEQQDADLLVIGGGITGAGIALDAASRGLRTILVEKGDFASGTSSRSSKLIHGGLRYLEHFRLGLMKESVSERHTLTRLAPGLVHWAPFILPRFSGTGRQWKYSIGLWLYDHLARTPSDLKHRPLDNAQVLECCPELRKDELQGAAQFYDCITDDARLVLSIVLDAQARGAKIYNYVAADEIIHKGRKAAGALVRDVLTGESWEIAARQIVSAAGPWTDDILARMSEHQKDRRIRPAKGVHIIIRRNRLNISRTVLIPSARDRRFLFVIPWYEGIVVGTTDTEYQGDPDSAHPERSDVDYILEALN
ncbi:MAG TPA: glycerol-3-phosphate dehydrogenase/oxidase, partial [Candidatus Acidoferrum sp.]|nr:glycerol-3-phosphate dehydrogenase/oxidase [Candidatus Acidoferrum sp.]